jgi:hypothetical protein
LGSKTTNIVCAKVKKKINHAKLGIDHNGEGSREKPCFV